MSACLSLSPSYTSSIPFKVDLILTKIFPHNRERRVENEVERVAELQGGRQSGVESEGATGGLAVVSVQSIESVKVRTYDSGMAWHASSVKLHVFMIQTIVIDQSFHNLLPSSTIPPSISIPHCLHPSLPLPLFSLSRVGSD